MENSNPQKKKLQTSSVISVFVFLADIYFIVNMKNNYAILGIAALATLFCILSTINAYTKWKEADSQRAEEHYVDIMKAEKSTHLVSQKSFQDMDEKLNFIGQKIMPLEKASSANQQKIATMLENLMDGQKKVAKVTISRSKENATALMNSNDQLIQRMEEFQQSILDMKTEVLEKQDEIYNKKLQKMDDNQKVLVDKIQESTSIFQNLQKMDDSQKELVEKIQESADLFQNLKKVDDNQKELVEKIQESTDLIKNIIEVIPEKIAQMPQLAQRESYPQNGFSVEEPSSMGQEPLPQMAGEEIQEDELAEEPVLEVVPETAELPMEQAVEMGLPEYAEEPESMELPEAMANVLPESNEMPEVLAGAEYADVPEVMEGTGEAASMEVPEEMVNAKEAITEAASTDIPEAMVNVGEAEFIEEAVSMELPESIGLPEEMAKEGFVELPEEMAKEESAELPEKMAEEESAELPEEMANAGEAASMEVPEAMAHIGEAEPIELPEIMAETESVETSGLVAEPEVNQAPIELANPEIISEPEEIVAPISAIEPALEAMPENIADAAPVPMEITQEALGTFPQAPLTPDPISAIGSSNGMMTPEDIAALLANTAEPEPEPEPEPIPAPFMGNGNGIMSPEEIAALIGNSAVEELPKMANRIEDNIKPPLPDMSDPGKMLSPEDIASLIANM